MVATWISNIASWKGFIAALGLAKGNALPVVGGIKIGYCSEKQTRGYLVAKMRILVYAPLLPGLTTMKCPSMSSQANPQISNPS